jgi:hypothetical protein
MSHDHTKFIHPRLHRTESGSRLFFIDKDDHLAIVYNWQDSSKWKVLPHPSWGWRAASYTMQFYDSLADAIRVFDMLCSTDGLRTAA